MFGNWFWQIFFNPVRQNEGQSESLTPPLIPAVGALTQAIRNFAKSLENWLTGAMMNIPEEMVRVKVFLW